LLLSMRFWLSRFLGILRLLRSAFVRSVVCCYCILLRLLLYCCALQQITTMMVRVGIALTLRGRSPRPARPSTLLPTTRCGDTFPCCAHTSREHCTIPPCYVHAPHLQIPIQQALIPLFFVVIVTCPIFP
jgi:hypothetical protein